MFLQLIFFPLQSKGIYGGVQVNGNIIIERSDENKRYYGHAVKAKDILLGGAVAIPESAQILTTVIEAAEGKEVDMSTLPANINIAPSEESGGAKDEEELAAMSTTNPDGTTASPTTTSPTRSRSIIPAVDGSPSSIDPDHPEEVIKRPSISSSTPPPRPPRRFIGSPSASPRSSAELNRENGENAYDGSKY